MNELVIGSTELTMSSREIAELTEKEHKNVLRVIRDLILNNILAAQIEPLKFSYRNQWFDYYELNKRDSLVVVARLSPEFTARIVDRWQELEAQQAFDPMQALNDPATMRGLLLNYSEKVIGLETKVMEIQPKADALDRLSTANGSLCLTDSAKNLQVRRKDLIDYLHFNKWIYKRPGGKDWIAYSDKERSGLLEHKTITITTPDGEERIQTQVRVTPKGLAKLATVELVVAEAA